MTDSMIAHALRVERGQASPEELAALVAVLCARGAAVGAEAPDAAEPAPTARWRRSERVYLFHAPRVWRAYERVGG